MNEKLKELAVQAGMEWETQSWCWLANPPHLERFAELVRQDYLRELKALKPVGIRYNYFGTVVSPYSDGLFDRLEKYPDIELQKLYALDEETK
jgi:hypothetical protein